MPWRLIIFIVIFAVFLIFITFNLENKCDISFGFINFTEVPVFITIFISFILGLICSVPLVMFIKRRRKGKQPEVKSKTPFVQSKDIPAVMSNEPKQSLSGQEPIDPSAARKKFMERKSGNGK